MAKKKLTAANPEAADAYYASLQQSKVTGGLPLADAAEVTARQREEDEANGAAPYLDEAESEELPAT